VALGGGVGAVMRFGLQNMLEKMSPSFPVGTLLVNLLGTFAAGLIWPVMTGLSAEYRLLLLTGFLGGFTTMSSFGLEVVLLWGQGRFAAGLAYWLLTAIGSIASCYLGSLIGRQLA
jgi:fluoride exporter